MNILCFLGLMYMIIVICNILFVTKCLIETNRKFIFTGKMINICMTNILLFICLHFAYAIMSGIMSFFHEIKQYMLSYYYSLYDELKQELNKK
jgi:hypothetical protein